MHGVETFILALLTDFANIIAIKTFTKTNAFIGFGGPDESIEYFHIFLINKIWKNVRQTTLFSGFSL